MSKFEMSKLIPEMEKKIAKHKALPPHVNRTSKRPDKICPQCALRSKGEYVICWHCGADIVPLPEGVA